MIVFCPNCGTQGTGIAGARSTCAACGSVFDVPADGARREPVPPPKPVAEPARPAAPPPPSFSAPPGRPLAAQRGRAPLPANNTLAVLSLVAGIICCVPVASPLVAIGAGVVALRQIDAAVVEQRGRGLAIAGIILGAMTGLIQLFYLIGAKHW